MPKIERFDDVLVKLRQLQRDFNAWSRLHRTAMQGYYKTKGGGLALKEEDREKNVEISAEYGEYINRLREEILETLQLFRERWANKSPGVVRWLSEGTAGAWRSRRGIRTHYRRSYRSAKSVFEVLGEAYQRLQEIEKTYREEKYWLSPPYVPDFDGAIEALTPPKDRDLARLRAEFDFLKAELEELPNRIESFSEWKSFAENIVLIAQSVEKEFVPRLRKWGRAGKELMLEVHIPRLSTRKLRRMTISDFSKLSEESQNEVNVMMSSLNSVIERLGLILKYAEDDKKGLKALEKAVEDAEERLKVHRESIKGIESMYEGAHLGASKATTDGLKAVEVSLGHELHYHKIIDRLVKEVVLRIERQVAALTSLRNHIERKSVTDIQKSLNSYLLLASPSRRMARRWKRVSFINLVRLLEEMVKKDEEAMGREHRQLEKLKNAGVPLAA